MITLAELNAMSATAFVAALGAVFEHAPWVAERAAGERPYPTAAALHGALFAAVEALPEEERLRFLRGHPELAAAHPLAAFSESEQAGLGLAGLDAARLARLRGMNGAYRERFGIPFILCARRHTRASVLRELARRLEGSRETEVATALVEVRAITRLRLAGLLGEAEGAGRVSTHVLDTAAGRPGAGIPVELFEVDDGAALRRAQAITDEDGRTAQPLLAGAAMRIGVYELRFAVGAYFGGRAGFLDVVPVRFCLAEPEAHYHVPLLVSPGGYTTYRGS